MGRVGLALGLALIAAQVRSEGLTPDRLGIVYNRDDPSSKRVATYYAIQRAVPAANIVGLSVPDQSVIDRSQLVRLRSELLDKLPTIVESLLLVWSRPYAVECMSITTAFAAGYQAGFCEPGCARTAMSPLFDEPGWLPADTVGWLPAMLLPSADEALARDVIRRGIDADGTRPPGVAYLIQTQDRARNVRAEGYVDAQMLLEQHLTVKIEGTPQAGSIDDAIAYFTGVDRVAEMHRIHFRPGAAADHLTSYGGILDGTDQMSAVEWLRQGATASYGSVSEPCAHPGKFPSPAILLEHYLHGETLLEAYWKSVAMPGQGIFIGEPLARPYATRP